MQMRIRDEVAYILPMAVFMAFTFSGTQWPAFYPSSYILKTVIVAILLAVLWRHFTRIRWTHLPLGVLVGVIGFVQWVGMEKLLMSQDWLSWTRMTGDIQLAAFRPYEHFDSPAMLWSFIAVRWLGASLVVPVMEELFWRDYAWRTIAAPNDFKLHGVGEYDTTGFWVVPLIFATVHVQWLTAIVWALLVGWLLLRTKSLGACIVAHGVTNFLLGTYVLISWYKFGRDEWFFW
jgi:CAAX prenyl protease-like protein